MYNVIVWGSGLCYETYFNSLKLQELIGSIKVLAIISDDRDIRNSLDGYPCLPLVDALTLDFDYCLLAIDNTGVIFQSIERLGLSGLTKDKFIPMRVLQIPNFDFGKYIALKESNLSILSSNCWAGVCYHRLGLEFMSPTINLFFDDHDFTKFMKNLDYYLSLPVEFVEMRFETNLQRDYPIGLIGDIRLNFNHYTDFNDAVACWEKRKKRLNKNNIFVVSYTDDEDDAIEFDNLPYEKKIIFTSFESNLKSGIYINPENKAPLSVSVLASANGSKNTLNLLSFLNHEDVFMRIT
ncbi:MAG: DUF1919 domain-containing protein [Lachnospiraceae bacterium]|nr:DUF1919 domain-containing protein [Lachnospiraceae bacterium]